MGSHQSFPQIEQNMPVPGTERPGQTAILRDPLAINGLWEFKHGIRTMQDLWVKNFNECPDANALGYRAKNDDGTLDTEKFTWLTYAQLKTIATFLGSGMEHFGFAPKPTEPLYQTHSPRLVAVYSGNSVPYVQLDIACSLYGFTTVPIYDTLGEEATQFMFEQTQCDTMFLTVSHIQGVKALIDSQLAKSIRHLVVMDEANLTFDHRTLLDSLSSQAAWHTWTDVINAGKQNLSPMAVIDPSDLYLISYTSGTTGQPKGAMVTHKAIVCTAMLERLDPLLTGPPVYLSYLPMAHVYERIMLIFVVVRQGQIGMFNGDVTKLTEDLALLKPTFFASVPRLYNKFYQKINAKFADGSFVARALVNKAVSTKLSNLKEDGSYKHWVYDKLVFSKVKMILGGNVQCMISGSAPIAEDVVDFFKICMGVPLLEGYGQTEGQGLEFAQDPRDWTSGNVGGITTSMELKLIDVPEMSYSVLDKDENGNPAPRGEVQVRGHGVIPGYFKNEAETKVAIDSEGWLHSGDIACLLYPTRSLKIMDRRKNIFKLSQGEYVAPDRLENVFKVVPGVQDVYVYGDSYKSVLVAIAVIDEAAYKKFAVEKAVMANADVEVTDHLINSEGSKAMVLKWFDQAATDAKLKGFEKIRKVFCVRQNFAELGLTTSTFKLKRNEAQAHFKTVLDDLYVGMD